MGYKFRLWRSRYEDALESQALARAALQEADARLSEVLACHPDARLGARPTLRSARLAVTKPKVVKKKPAAVAAPGSALVFKK